MIPTADAQYIKLTKGFALMPLVSGEHYDAAIEMLGKILSSTPEPKGTTLAYVQVLTQLIHNYENATFASKFKDVPGNELLQHLMTENSLNQTDIVNITGLAKQNISAFIAGTRGLPRQARKKLGDKFKLDPSVFDTYELRKTNVAKTKRKRKPPTAASKGLLKVSEPKLRFKAKSF